MPKALVIVESPAKARTISRFLDDDYVVESSMGHIRDLPRSATEIPAAYKDQPWARLGIDVDSDFKAIYVLDSDKSSHIKKLKKLAAKVDTIFLATDEDREGEAIAWHLLEELSPPAGVEVKRMVFHEITRQAIEQAVSEPRDIDYSLVDAQEARRMLDRLYGFEVSPVLWKKIKPQLSAGRVQSVAVRMIVERERERMAFKSASYWSVAATLSAGGAGASNSPAFSAALTAVNGQKIATGKDFNDSGELQHPAGAELLLLNGELANQISSSLKDQPVQVADLSHKAYRRRPQPPFITSTLQQEAANKLRLSSENTMRAAQGLYEDGFITYMRTDSTSLAAEAVTSARAEIKQSFGDSYLPDKPRDWHKKVKNAQEAHEAIRPAGGSASGFRPPAEVARQVNDVQAKVYELIYQRTLASQMTDAVGETVSAQFSCDTGTHKLTLSAAGTTITHPGWQAVYPQSSSDDPNLPPLEPGQTLTATDSSAEDHQTKPPARYTEATLIRQLEGQGIGRPSTYASIIRTIMNRGYVYKHGSQLVPDFTAFSVVNLLSNHFPDLVDYAFTARMEDDLDRIANGEQERIPWLKKFYFGDQQQLPGLKTMVSEHLDEIDPRTINELVLGADSEGNKVSVRVGRYGPYVQKGEESKSLPDGILPDELTTEKALEILAIPDAQVLGADPETGEEITVRTGRFGPYVQLGEGDKPKRASLLATMTVNSITLDDALQLLTLPRTVGTTEDGEIITANNGRYGPYIQKGDEYRSLDTEEQMFEVTLEESVRLFSQPKSFKRRAAAVLREMGKEPETDKPIQLKNGRFGPYVTDGETNASLGKGKEPETLTLEEAVELLQKRRERIASGQGKKPAKKKAATKKTTTKKAAGKSTGKTATKTPAKTAAKKPATAKKTTTKTATKKPAATKSAAAKKTTTKTTTKTTAKKPSGAE